MPVGFFGLLDEEDRCVPGGLILFIFFASDMLMGATARDLLRVHT
jgi:hypothetical protein